MVIIRGENFGEKKKETGVEMKNPIGGPSQHLDATKLVLLFCT